MDDTPATAETKEKIFSCCFKERRDTDSPTPDKVRGRQENSPPSKPRAETMPYFSFHTYTLPSLLSHQQEKQGQQSVRKAQPSQAEGGSEGGGWRIPAHIPESGATKSDSIYNLYFILSVTQSCINISVPLGRRNGAVAGTSRGESKWAQRRFLLSISICISYCTELTLVCSLT